MNEMNGRTLSLLSIQFFSFILLLLFLTGMETLPIGLFSLIVIELLIIMKRNDGLRTTLILWQFQVFIVAFLGLVLYPKSFLNTSETNSSVQLFLTIALLIVEAIVLVFYKYSERAIVSILKGSTVSMLLVVVLILVLIGSEGLYGFTENDPIRMLTTSEFNASGQPGYTTTSQLTTEIMPYNFTLDVSDSNLHMYPFTHRNITLSIQNTGALNDSYQVTVDNSSGIGILAVSASQEVALAPGGNGNLSFDVGSTYVGEFDGIFLVTSAGLITKQCTLKVHVSKEGLDFTKDKMSVYAQGLYSSIVSVPLGLTNTGDNNTTTVLKITAPAYFTPFLNIPEWNYSSVSATVSLSPGEQFNFTFIPRFLTAVDGTYTLVLGAFSSNGLTPIDNFTLTFDAVSDRLATGERPGSIPIVAGSVTHWNISISDPGVDKLDFQLTNVPDGMSVTALINGSEQVSILGSPIYLDGNGSANLELLLSTKDQSMGHVSVLNLVITTGGNRPNFGMTGFIAGSAVTVIIAILIAIPLGLGSAIFLSQYCSDRSRRLIRPFMDILTGVPSVIFGLWGAMTFGPLLAHSFYPLIDSTLGSAIPFFSGPYELGRSVLTASIVLAIMIFPIIMALSYEAISSVQSDLKDSSQSLGATKWQTIRRVVLPKARSGIIGATILAIGRALGETMAVVMIMNYSPAVPSSIFSNGSTMTSAIALNFGTAYADSQARHGLFSIALLLFAFVLVLNYVLVIVTSERFWARIQKSTNRITQTVANLRQGISHKWISKDGDRSAPVQELSLRSTFYSSARMKRSDSVMMAILYCLAIVMIGVIIFILGDILVRGGTAFQMSYLTQTQLGGGGFLNAITGSLMLIGMAILIAAPLTLLSAIYVHEYSGQEGRLFKISYIAVSTLSSTPSIIFGAFGFMLFVLYFGFGFSLLAGGLTLAFMVIPILYVSNFEAIRSVPQTHREASYALGISKWTTIREIVIPNSLPAISSGIILGVGRAIGETAAVLLTAGFATFLTSSVTEPAASMPVMIYQMYDVSAGNPLLMQKMYAAAFLLISMVMALNLIGKAISHFLARRAGVC